MFKITIIPNKLFLNFHINMIYYFIKKLHALIG